MTLNILLHIPSDEVIILLLLYACLCGFGNISLSLPRVRAKRQQKYWHFSPITWKYVFPSLESWTSKMVRDQGIPLLFHIWKNMLTTVFCIPCGLGAGVLLQKSYGHISNFPSETILSIINQDMTLI